MEVNMHSKDEKWAIFWCSLLHPVLFGEIEPDETHRYLKKLSGQECLFPNGKKKKPSLSTLKRKLKKYRQTGFEALARKRRCDRGKPRAVAQEIIDKAIEIKRDQPKRSHHAINLFLKDYCNVQIPRSTLYRHLKQNGATRLKLGVVKKKVRCRWTREHPNELWVGDFSNGPYVLVDGEVQPTYISLFIDCCSRYVVEGRYYLRQSLDILIDSLLRAWTIHGIPKELYVDNAKIYHANALKAACYALHIKLLHRPPGDPPPGGLVERIFGTSQDQFEAEVRAGDILTLHKLNKAFFAWLNVVYHETVHSETKEITRKLFQEGRNTMRTIDMDYAIKFFMKTLPRTVHPDFSDVAIDKRFYSVDPKLRGDKVLVRYDPFSTMDKVFIYSKNEEFLATGTLYNREKRNHPVEEIPSSKPRHNYIDLILAKHEKQLSGQAKGIDYTKLISRQRWPFAAFVQKLASLMGRKGGTSAFNTQELETLKKLYNKHSDLTEPKLVKAFEKAEVKNIAHLAYQLQNLRKE
ncbi:Transposase [Candidatus Methanophagaceae archaeon]|nr:Transposase [Methanophagales archaeon]